MPRNPGTGVYEQPLPDVITATTIESTVYNGFVNDVETDLNTPRPVVAGGTGANNATTARDNLDAEVAKQVVANFDTHIWENGSFASNDAATNSPVVGKSFVGDAYVHFDVNFASVTARCVNDAALAGREYTRTKNAGFWGAWKITGADEYVNVTGDDMFGHLGITETEPTIILNKTGATSNNYIIGGKSGVNRWATILGNSNAETGANAGSDFIIQRCNDAGAALSPPPIAIFRSSGNIVIGTTTAATSTTTGALTVSGGLGVGGAIYGTNIWAGQAPYPAVLGAMMVGYQPYGIYLRPQNDTGVFPLVFQNAASAGVGSIATNSTTTTYNTSSDERLKEDLKSFEAGNIVDDTQVYDFAWKSTGERSYGILAQQAVNIYPAAVNYDETQDWWGIDYSKYVPVILQELKALRVRVAELEGRLGGQAGVMNVPHDVARSVVESLKTSPFLLALIIINVIALLGFGYVLHEISDSMERREAWVKYCLEKKG